MLRLFCSVVKRKQSQKIISYLTFSQNLYLLEVNLLMHTLKWYTLIHQIMFFSEFFKTMEPLKKAKYRRVSQHCADLPKKKRKKRNMLIFEIMH